MKRKATCTTLAQRTRLRLARLKVETGMSYGRIIDESVRRFNGGLECPISYDATKPKE